jgi:hypothetical protein
MAAKEETDDCGKITFIVGATFTYEYRQDIPDTNIKIEPFSISVPYICDGECIEKECIWYDIDCAKKCWGVCCAWKTSCKEEICIAYVPEWCEYDLPLWPASSLKIENSAKLYINYTTNTSTGALLKSFNNLGELTFGFSSGNLKLNIDEVNVLKIDLRRYIIVITTSGAIKFYYEAYKYEYKWEGLTQKYSISVGFQLCPFTGIISVLLKLEVLLIYYGVEYKAKQEVPIPLVIA